MATPVFCCGFECGQLGAAGQHWTSATGYSISTSTKKNGDRALRVNVTAGTLTAIAPIVTISSNFGVARFYIYFATLPGLNNTLVSFNNGYGVFFEASSGKIFARAAAGGNGATGVVVTTSTWYCIDLFVNSNANPWTVNATVDGTALGQASRGIASAALTSFQITPTAAGDTFDIFFDDFIISTTNGDYPIGEGKVNHFIPTSDGTHTAAGTTTVKGTIATPVGTAITAATTDAFNWVNGVPLLGGATDNTRLINAQTAASTTYVEVVFGPAPGISTPTAAPRAVEVITADREATTATADFTVKLNDNGTENSVVARGVVAGVVTDRYARKHYGTAPTGGAWTVSAGAGNFNNIRARFGYSSDATPDQYWRGIMIEAEFLETTTTTSTTTTTTTTSGVATVKAFSMLGVG